MNKLYNEMVRDEVNRDSVNDGIELIKVEQLEQSVYCAIVLDLSECHVI